MRKFLEITSILLLTTMLGIASIYIVSTSTSWHESIVSYLEANTQNISGTWCWIDICPNQTLYYEARAQVDKAGEKILRDLTSGLWIELEPETNLYFDSTEGRQTDPVAAITIDFRPHSISLGDAIRLFGTPFSIRRDAENKPVWHRSICFEGGLCAYFEGSKSILSPHMSLTALSFLGSDDRGLKSVFRSWTGFVSLPFRD
jgi:hypothetical protein